MEPELNTAMHRQTRAALEGVASADLGTIDSTALVLVLTVVGDAVRLGLQLPAALTSSMKHQLAEAHVLAALATTADSVEAWSLPTLLDEDDDPGLEWALRRRDEVESIRTAARRAMLPRGVFIDASPEAKRVESALRGKDLTCGSQVKRSDAERMLGDRLAFVDERSWFEQLPWVAEDSLEETGPELEAIDGARPSLESLELFVVEGKLGRWVRSAAAKSPELAEELEEMIDSYLEAVPTGVSYSAQRWRAQRASGPDKAREEAARVVPIRLRAPKVEVRRAAASVPELPKEPSLTYELAELSEVDAVATLMITPTKITLQIFEGTRALREVRLGHQTIQQPTTGHTWIVELDRHTVTSDAVLIFSVLDQHGGEERGAFIIDEPS